MLASLEKITSATETVAPPKYEAALRHISKINKTPGKPTRSGLWVLALADNLVHQVEFDATGMNDDEINKKVALEALEYIIKAGRGDILLGVYHQGVRRYVMSVFDIIPTMTITTSQRGATAVLDALAKEKIGVWNTPEPSKQLKQKNQRQQTEAKRASTIGLSADKPSRTIYSDASLHSDSWVGAGYVIRDAACSENGGKEEWSLKFGSGRTRASLEGSTDLAEMRAIRLALWDPAAITDEMRINQRTLTIVCDNQHAIDFLVSLQRGTSSHHGFNELPDMVAAAKDIMAAIKGIETVDFVWTKGHGANVLNRAAHALANYERKHGLASENPDEAKKKQLTDHFVREIALLGIVPSLMD